MVAHLFSKLSIPSLFLAQTTLSVIRPCPSWPASHHAYHASLSFSPSYRSRRVQVVGRPFTPCHDAQHARPSIYLPSYPLSFTNLPRCSSNNCLYSFERCVLTAPLRQKSKKKFNAMDFTIDVKMRLCNTERSQRQPNLRVSIAYIYLV